MTSQRYGILHVMVKTLSYNDSFDWGKIPKKALKLAGRDYDEYLRLFVRDVGTEAFERSREKRVLRMIFEKLNTEGYYQLPESYYHSLEVSNAN